MRATLLGTAAATALSMCIASTASAVLIDDYSKGGELLVNAGFSTPTNTYTDPGPTYAVPLADHTRYTQIAFAPGMTAGASFGIQQSTTKGELAFTNTTAAWAVFTVRYGDTGTLDLSGTGSPTTNGLAVNFSGITFNPLPGQDVPTLNGGIPTLTITAADTSGHSSSVTESLSNTGSSGAIYTFAQAAFSPLVNFASIDTLTLQINSNIQGAAFTLDELSTTTVVDSAMPEPASLSILGLAGIGLMRRRR